MNWTTEKPTQPGWYRQDPAAPPKLIYCGAVWDHNFDFAGLDEPVTFMSDHLMEGEWAGPLEPPMGCRLSAQPGSSKSLNLRNEGAHL